MSSPIVGPLSLDMPPPGPLERQGAKLGGPVRNKSKSSRYAPYSKPKTSIVIPPSAFNKLPADMPSTPRPMSIKEKTASKKLSPDDLFALQFGTPTQQFELTEKLLENIELKSEND